MLYALRSLSGYAGSESVHICEQSRTRVAALAKAWCWWEGNRDPIQGSAGGLELDTWASDVKRRDGVGSTVPSSGCRTASSPLHYYTGKQPILSFASTMFQWWSRCTSQVAVSLGRFDSGTVMVHFVDEAAYRQTCAVRTLCCGIARSHCCVSTQGGWVAQAVQHHRPPRLRGGLVSIGFHRHRALAEKLESSHGRELG